MKKKEPLLNVKGLNVGFQRYDRGWKKSELQVIHNLDVDVSEGEVVAVVGSSGSGKSILAHALLGILPENARADGDVEFMGSPLTKKRREALRGKEIVLVPQSVDFLDPLMKVGDQLLGRDGKKDRMNQVLAKLGLEPEVASMYPFQLSGGMARRVLVGTAMMGEPKLIIADEPTPGLDLQRAKEALQIFRKLADEGCGVLLITHDFDMAVKVADRVAVFYAGSTVEICAAKDFMEGGTALRHPYSRALIHALPQNGFVPLKGCQPFAGSLPEGCAFGSRCFHHTESCMKKVDMRPIRGGKVRCIHGA